MWTGLTHPWTQPATVKTAHLLWPERGRKEGIWAVLMTKKKIKWTHFPRKNHKQLYFTLFYTCFFQMNNDGIVLITKHLMRGNNLLQSHNLAQGLQVQVKNWKSISSKIIFSDNFYNYNTLHYAIYAIYLMLFTIINSVPKHQRSKHFFHHNFVLIFLFCQIYDEFFPDISKN